MPRCSEKCCPTKIGVLPKDGEQTSVKSQEIVPADHFAISGQALTDGFAIRHVESLEKGLQEQRRTIMIAKIMGALQAIINNQANAIVRSIYVDRSLFLPLVPEDQFPFDYFGFLPSYREEYGEDTIRHVPSLASTAVRTGPDKISLLGPSDLSPMTVKEQALYYLKLHKIFELYIFLSSHLLQVRPGSPVAFLTDLIDKCLIYKAGGGAPPLLYEEHHYRRFFRKMDCLKDGAISEEQCQMAFKLFNLGEWPSAKTEVNLKESSKIKVHVDEDTFVSIAYNRGMELFDALVHSSIDDEFQIA